MASVQLQNLVKYFGDSKVVQGINLNIDNNEFVALVGPSGCGKSTTLRMIAGLESISEGEVYIDGEVVNELSPKDRDIAMVFQDYALYPHMNVYENMSFGLSIQKIPKNEINIRVQAAAQALNIENLLDRKPKQLSGGQRQRVAMGRAIVRRPKVFLFDEPLSNLDAKLRMQMRTEIKKLHQSLKTTMIYVTHDQVEAMTLADKIVVLQGGVIEQIGTPDQVYNHPKSVFVAGFIGSPSMNFLPATISPTATAVDLNIGPDQLSLPFTTEQCKRFGNCAGMQVTLGIRPENIEPASDESAHMHPIIDVIEPLGSETLVFFKIGTADLVARLSPSTRATRRQPLGLKMNIELIHLFDAKTGKVLINSSQSI